MTEDFMRSVSGMITPGWPPVRERVAIHGGGLLDVVQRTVANRVAIQTAPAHGQGREARVDVRSRPDDYASMRGVLRTVEVLRALNVRNGASVVELASITGISRPALYRILETLREAGYVALDLSGIHYSLTLMVRGLAEGFAEEDWVTQLARPALKALQKQILWPVDLGTFMDNGMWIRETTRPLSTLTIDRGTVGFRFPMLRSATGRAYLAHCPADEREIILENLVKAQEASFELIKDRPRLDAMLHEIRERGFGLRQNEEPMESSAIAVPILAPDRVLGCVNMTFIRRAMPPSEAAERYLSAMQTAAALIAEGAAASSGADQNP